MMFLARASAGLWIWAVGLTLLYSLHGIGCAGGLNRIPLAFGTVFRWAMVGTWLLLCAAAAASIWWAGRAPPGMQRRLATVSAWVGFAGTIVTGMPVVLASACV